jgi:hypothetical protein
VAPEPAGANCAHGGTKVVVYTDTNGNGALDAAEQADARTVFFCHGATGDAGALGAVGAIFVSKLNLRTKLILTFLIVAL